MGHRENYYKSKMVNSISIITFTVNGLNTSIKRQRLSDWILKRLKRMHLKHKHTGKFKAKGWEKI